MELKPCPFCGNKKISAGNKHKWHNRDVDVEYQYLYCGKCHARGGVVSGYVRSSSSYLFGGIDKNITYTSSAALLERATELWNRRADNG